MPYYEYEITIENLSEILKQKEAAEKEAYGEGQKNAPSANKMKMPSMPRIPNIRIPK